MSKKGKKYQEVAKLVDHAKIYTLDEAVELLPKLRTAKFDETIEVCMKLNVDPKQADQNVRGVVTLPAGTGKTCLLYTSDAADDLLCVDLGGRRIIKKKK